MSCMVNSDGSSTCCAPGGPCSTSPPPKPFTLKAGQIVRHKVYTGLIGGPMDPTAFIEEEGVATGGKDGERWIIQMNNGETRYLRQSEMVVPIIISGGVKKALPNYDIVGGNSKTPNYDIKVSCASETGYPQCLIPETMASPVCKIMPDPQVQVNWDLCVVRKLNTEDIIDGPQPTRPPIPVRQPGQKCSDFGWGTQKNGPRCPVDCTGNPLQSLLERQRMGGGRCRSGSSLGYVSEKTGLTKTGLLIIGGLLLYSIYKK